MSQHHRAQKWSTHSPKLRAKIAPQLPLPCVNCGRAVQPGDAWQVGHRRDAALGGRPTLQNCGPAHTSCNRTAGGRLGAAITNARRAQKRPRSEMEW